VGRLGPSTTIALVSCVLSACSLVSLDSLQDFEGSGGASTGAGSSSGPGEATTGASTTSTVTAASSSQASSSTSVASSSVASTGSGGEGQGGAGGGGTGGGAPITAYADAVLADGPVAYLRLDEEPGNGTAEDSIGSFDGTLVGGVTWREPGAVADTGNASIRFDGTSGALVLGDVLDFPDGAPFSIELWAKRDDVAPLPTLEWLFSKEVGLNETREGYCLLLTTELRLGAEVWFGELDAAVAYKKGPTPNGAWHHLVVTGSTTSLLVYVDGVAYGSGGFTAGLADTDGPLIFAAQAGIQNNFEGWLDEIAVYDVELTPAQVAAHRAAAD
jgi:hypothetical protein